MERYGRLMRLRYSALLVDDYDAAIAFFGEQFAGRVGYFLEVDDAVAEYERLRGLGVEFESAPRTEPYGTVAVFRDVAGNRWDLLS